MAHLPTQISRMRPRRLRRWRAAGLTLIELLVVIAILVLLMGFGAGAYFRMSRSYREQGSAAELDVLLRQTRNSAIGANAAAFVLLDLEARTVTPWAYRMVGLWHFERMADFGRSPGAHHDASLRGAKINSDGKGKIGNCVELRQNASIDLGADPDFDLADGGCVEAYIRSPAGYVFTGDNYVFFKEGAYSLKIGTRGILVGNTGVENIASRSYRVAPGRWTKVALAWDSQSTRILVDDAIVARGPGSRPKITDEPLLIGHEGANFIGLVDEVRVLAAIAGNPLKLAEQWQLKHNTEPWNAVFFDSDGALDMRYHPGPLWLKLIQQRRVRTVTISMLGITTRKEVENVPAPGEEGAAP